MATRLEGESGELNQAALVAVGVFAAAFVAIFGSLYIGASRSHGRGELALEGIHLLRWALLGHLTVFAILAVTAFLT